MTVASMTIFTTISAMIPSITTGPGAGQAGTMVGAGAGATAGTAGTVPCGDGTVLTIGTHGATGRAGMVAAIVQ